MYIVICCDLQLKMKTSWIVLLCIALMIADARSLRRHGTGFLCSDSTPCGWQVYKPYDRTPQDYMKSPCKCPENTKCVQTGDDISISAYVYHCREVD